MQHSEEKILRNGYTTGSAASAAAVAAYRHSTEDVNLILPNGDQLAIPIARVWAGGAEVVKDGGDDPDVTTGSLIQVELVEFSGIAEESDYVESLGDLELLIRGGIGVGRVNRPGLAVPVGKAAINPTPRRMLLINLAAANCKGRYLVTISVPDGEKIAQKTLNPTLGIIGGISILGNSGIVRPYSNAAYAATIVLQLKSCAASNLDTVALVTGNRSAAAVQRDCPMLSEESIIRIGDFIQVAILAAEKANLKKIIIGCMAGKLFKYACGETNTHAHKCKLTLSRLHDFGVELSGVALDKLDSMGELAAMVDEKTYDVVLQKVYLQAGKIFKKWAPKLQIELWLYDDAQRRIL